MVALVANENIAHYSAAKAGLIPMAKLTIYPDATLAAKETLAFLSD